MADEWRVEVDLADDPRRGLTERILGERLDEEARERLGGRVIVTHDGPHLFLYSGSEQGAREAERMVRELVAAEEVPAEVALTRWHPDEEAWKDASQPLPRTEEERAAERERHLAAETREAAEEGGFDWEVRLDLPGRREAVELAERVRADGLPVFRRWKWVHVKALTEEGARELAERLRAEAPEGTEVDVEPTFDEPAHPIFVFLRSR